MGVQWGVQYCNGVCFVYFVKLGSVASKLQTNQVSCIEVAARLSSGRVAAEKLNGHQKHCIRATRCYARGF